MERDERERAEVLDRHWDAVVRGQPVPPSPVAATDLTELLDRLHAEAIPQLFPDPRRTWHVLLRESAPDSRTRHPADVVAPAWCSLNGHVKSPGDDQSRDRPRTRLPRLSPGRALSQLATAALLLVTLAVGYTAIVQQRPAVVDEAIPVPAIVGLLETAPGVLAPAGVTEETLLAATFTAAELPGGELDANFYRLTLPPGASLPYLAGPLCGCSQAITAGVGAEFIESGALTMRLESPLWVERGGESEARQEIPAGMEITLTAGDSVNYPNYTAPGEIRNAGAVAVELVGVALIDAEQSPSSDLTPPEGVTGELFTSTTSMDWRQLPEGPLTVTLHRLTLPPGTRIGPYAPAGLQALHVERGAITRGFLRPSEDPADERSLSHRANSTALFVASPSGARHIVASTGDEPAVLLVVTIEPAALSPLSLAP